jgi:hypothetical protein
VLAQFHLLAPSSFKVQDANSKLSRHFLQAPITAAVGPGSVSFTGRAGRATFTANTAAGDSAGAPAPEPTPVPVPAKKAASKPRLPGLDSLRFFLIAYIAVGHFVAFATRDPFILKLFTQVGGGSVVRQAAVLAKARQLMTCGAAGSMSKPFNRCWCGSRCNAHEHLRF